MFDEPYGYDTDGDGDLDGEDHGSSYGYDFDGDGDIDADDDFQGDMMLYPGGDCFIATAVYGDYDHPQVKILREFRDQFLKKYCLGRIFIQWYYRGGPRIVNWLEGKLFIRGCMRLFLYSIGLIYNYFILILDSDND